MATNEAPNGFAWVPFGGSGDSKGTLEIKGSYKDDDGNRVQLPTVSVDGIEIPFPTTKKAMDEYAKDRTYTVLDSDGNEIVHHGVYALAASKIPHDYETFRGKYRAAAAKIHQRGGDPIEAIDPEAVRGTFRTIYRPGMDVQTEAVDAAALEDMSPDEIIALMKSKGWAK